MLADAQAAPDLTAVGARKDLPRRARQYGRGAIDADGGVVNIGIGHAGDPCPAFAAVPAAAYPVDLATRPDQTVVRGIDGESRHPGNAYIGAFLGHLHRQLVPVTPTIGRAEQRSRPRARKDDFGVDRIEGHLPDVQRVHRRVEPLETFAGIFAAVDAVIGAGQYGLRLFGVNRETEHAAFGPQSGPHLPPTFSAIGADPRASPHRANTYAEVIGHG